MKNWTINEAVQVIREGKDVEAIKEIGSHFPVFAMAAAQNNLYGVAVLMGDKFTLNRLAKEPVNINTEDEEAQAVDGNGDEKADAPGSKALEEMTTKELMKLCDKRGIKVPHYGKNKQYYLEQLQEHDVAEDNIEEAEWEEAQADPYEGKTAKELHVMCKERGIKADIKKPAKFYADLLRKADEKEDTKDEAADNDDWAEEESPKAKPATKGGNKPTAKAKPVAKPAEDNDDWDI